MNLKEEWKAVPGYEDRYEVSNFGRVLSLTRIIERSDGRKSKLEGRLRNLGLNSDGYPAVKLYKNSKAKNVKVHRLVAQCFVDNPKNKKIVNHLDGDKTNNLATNLEWVTSSENAQHAYDTGLFKPNNPNVNGNCQGEKNGSSKLTEKDVLFIRENARKNGGKLTQKVMSERFGVGNNTISNIVNFNSWKHIV